MRTTMLREWAYHEFDRREYTQAHWADVAGLAIFCVLVFAIVSIPIGIASIWIPMVPLGWMIPMAAAVWATTVTAKHREMHKINLIEHERDLFIDLGDPVFNLSAIERNESGAVYGFWDRVGHVISSFFDGEYSTRYRSKQSDVDEFLEHLQHELDKYL